MQEVRIPSFGHLFSRCSRIDKLELEMNITLYSEEFEAILNAINELPIEELILTNGMIEFTLDNQ